MNCDSALNEIGFGVVFKRNPGIGIGTGLVVFPCTSVDGGRRLFCLGRNDAIAIYYLQVLLELESAFAEFDEKLVAAHNLSLEPKATENYTCNLMIN